MISEAAQHDSILKLILKMAARSRVTRSGRLNPDFEAGQVIDVPFNGDVVNQSVQTPANPPQMTPTRSSELSGLSGD